MTHAVWPVLQGRDIETAPLDKSIIYVWDDHHQPRCACWFYPREDKKTPEKGQWVDINDNCRPLKFSPKYWGWTDEIPQCYRL